MPDLEPQLRHLLIDLCALPAEFNRDSNLYLDLGVPSVKAMELLLELEERFGVSVPDDQFVEATSLARLTSMMQDLIQNTHVG